MLRERSFGAVVYRRAEKKILYLLLLYGKDYWDFPKGHAETGEHAVQTMKREVEEETGLHDLLLIPGFKENISYFFRSAGALVAKDVVFFLVMTTQEEITLSPEHNDARWVTFEEGMDIMRFKNSQAVLQKAHDFLGRGVESQRTL